MEIFLLIILLFVLFLIPCLAFIPNYAEYSIDEPDGDGAAYVWFKRGTSDVKIIGSAKSKEEFNRIVEKHKRYRDKFK